VTDPTPPPVLPGAELRPLGDSGLQVSAIGLGGNNFGRALDFEASERVIEAALELGVNHFDTADGYGGGDSERFLGRALGGRREQVVIATKFGSGYGPDYGLPLGSADYARRCAEDSLERLGTDYIDLFYLHLPDPATPIRETLEGLWSLIDRGVVRAIGCSNFSPEQLREAEDTARSEGRPHFAVAQNEYNLVNRGVEDELLALAAALDIGFVPYFPLASGLLSGKYRAGEAPPPGTRLADPMRPVLPEHWALAERARSFAEARGRSVLELAVGALLSRPGVTSVIAGATKPEQVRANVEAARWRLDAAELAELAAALDG
jgi:aryl-alcohol dehydrogenase-like predicted oxidoreductase